MFSQRNLRSPRGNSLDDHDFSMVEFRLALAPKHMQVFPGDKMQRSPD